MSLITLRSTESLGNRKNIRQESSSNFQNFFKDPIRFKKNDTIQVTNLTITKDLENPLQLNKSQIQYRMGPAPAGNFDAPFYNIHLVNLDDGYYNGPRLAKHIQDKLNNSRTMIIYIWRVDWNSNSTLTITLSQQGLDQLVATSNTEQQLLDNGGNPIDSRLLYLTNHNLAQYDLQPLQDTDPPSVDQDIFKCNFKLFQTNSDIPGPTLVDDDTGNTFQPFTAENQVERMSGPSLNKNVYEEDLLEGLEYKYRFDKGLYANASNQKIQVSQTFALEPIRLLDKANNVSHIKIGNFNNVNGRDLFFKVRHAQLDRPDLSEYNGWDYLCQSNIPATSDGFNLNNKFKGQPKTIGLQDVSPFRPFTGATGLKWGQGNIQTDLAGAGYVVNQLYQVVNKPGTTTPVPSEIAILVVNSLQAGGIGNQDCGVLFMGEGYQEAGQYIVTGQGVTTPSEITIKAGGLRTNFAGKQNPSGLAITEGEEYQVFFPREVFNDPPIPGTPATLTDVTNSMNSINLRISVDEIEEEADGNKYVFFVSPKSLGQPVGTNRGLIFENHDNFERLLQYLTASDTLVLKSNQPLNLQFNISTSYIKVDTRFLYDSGLYFKTFPTGCFGYTKREDDTADNFFPDGSLPVDIETQFGLFLPSNTDPAGQFGGKARGYLPDNYGFFGINEINENGEFFNFCENLQLYDAPNDDDVAIENFFESCKPRQRYSIVSNVNKELTNDILFNTLDGFTELPNSFHIEFEPEFSTIKDTGDDSEISFTLSEYNFIIKVNYSVDLENGTRKTAIIEEKTDLLQLTDYDIKADDTIEMGIVNGNALSFFIGNDTAFKKLDFDLLQLINNKFPGSQIYPIRESFYPAICLFEWCPGLPCEPIVGNYNYGVEYTVEGQYDNQIVNGRDNNDNLTEPYTTLFFDQNDSIFTGCENPDTDVMTADNSGPQPGFTMPLTIKFKEIQPENVVSDNNPTPFPPNFITTVGQSTVVPNTATFGYEFNFPDSQLFVTGTSDKAITSGAINEIGQPDIIVEIPELNIEGYSGASGDKFKTVAVIPSSEWTTNRQAGNLFFKTQFPLPIDVNLPEDREVYSLTCRLRNMNGTLVDNLINPTTITIYKSESEESKLASVLLERKRQERQDGKISTASNKYPLI